MFPNSINAEITLLKVESTKNDIGVSINSIKSKRKLMCSLKSITRLEYQTSVEISRNIEIKAVLQSFLYQGEKYGVLGNDVYKIERTFINGEFIELYLSKSDIEVNL